MVEKDKLAQRIARNEVFTHSGNVAFAVAALVLAITPGPGLAYVIARTAAGGRSEGLASCVGTALGGMVHVLAAALGLSLVSPRR